MGKKHYYKSHRRIPNEGYAGALLRMLPAFLTLGVVPLIVRQYAHETGLTQYGWFDIREVCYEFFLASKSVVLVVLMFVMSICIIMRLFKEKKQIRFTAILVPLMVYGALAFLSACVSVNRSFSFSGGYEQFENVWVLLGYVLIVYYIFLYAQDELELVVLTDAICFSSTIVGLLGTLQGFGIDYLANGIVQRLITTERLINQSGGSLTINFTDGQAVSTLYNPNYLGVYGSFIVPFLAILILYGKNKWRRIWHVADFVLVVVALLSSRSRAGLIAVVISLCFAAVICFRGILKYWYFTVPAINFAVVIVLLVNAYNDNLIFDRLKNIFVADVVNVTESIAEDGTVIRQTGLTELYTTADSVVMTYNDVTVSIYLYCEDGYYGLYALQENGEQIEITNVDSSIFVFEHPALAGIKLSPIVIEEFTGFILQADGNWPFVYNDDKGKFQYVRRYENDNGENIYKQSDMTMAESFGFENYQTFFTNRGFIWSRTIPLLKKHIFLGSGPDTFLLEFPQEDYLRMKQYGFEYNVMTKPHSWYLQVGVQTGVLSLLCILVFYVWYAIWSLRLYAFRKLSSQIEGFGIAAFIGSIGYMISGISNDSMVVTAPVFWGMIGLGIVANSMVSKMRKKQNV